MWGKSRHDVVVIKFLVVLSVQNSPRKTSLLAWNYFKLCSFKRIIRILRINKVHEQHFKLLRMILHSNKLNKRLFLLFTFSMFSIITPLTSETCALTLASLLISSGWSKQYCMCSFNFDLWKLVCQWVRNLYQSTSVTKAKGKMQLQLLVLRVQTLDEIYIMANFFWRSSIS